MRVDGSVRFEGTEGLGASFGMLKGWSGSVGKDVGSVGDVYMAISVRMYSLATSSEYIVTEILYVTIPYPTALLYEESKCNHSFDTITAYRDVRMSR